jgi:hypothetical protein
MAEGSYSPEEGRVGPLSVEQLEAGLRVLKSVDISLDDFWDEHIASFRQTVLLAIRETSDALLSPSIALHWRVRFESQLEALVEYLKLADRYIARRQIANGPKVVEFRRPERRVH